MIFSDADQAVTSSIDDPIGIAQVLFVGERLRWGVALLAIQLLIGKIGEIQRAVMDTKRSPAVFMDTGAGIEGGGSSLNRRVYSAYTDNFPFSESVPKLRCVV